MKIIQVSVDFLMHCKTTINLHVARTKFIFLFQFSYYYCVILQNKRALYDRRKLNVHSSLGSIQVNYR